MGKDTTGRPASPPLQRAKNLPFLARRSDTHFKHSAFYLELAHADIPETLRSLGTSLVGLTEEEAEARLAAHGLNEIGHEKYHWPKQLIGVLVNPFNILLGTLATISYATDDLKGALVMATMVVISVMLTFFQEFRSSKAAEKLKAMVSNNALVTRRFLPEGEDSESTALKSETRDVLINHLALGDLVHLSAGDMLPADLRLLSAKDLFISQSALTGESIPVEKNSNSEPSSAKEPLECHNLCFMGTTVVSGTASGVVIKTGTQTYLGSIAQSISRERVKTSFDLGIERFTWLMLRFMLVMVPVVFLVNGLTKGNWFDAFMFAIAVAVGLTPEMLPMIVTVNLAKGAMAMANKKVIVKRLTSIQNFGAMDVLCTDKTGTLTQDKVVLEKYIDAFGKESDRALKYAYLNSFYQTGLRNLLDIAVLKHQNLKEELQLDQNYRKIDEIPFDFNRKRMSVVVEKQARRHILICKGAIEEMFSICTQAEVGRDVVPISSVNAEHCHQVARDLNDDGLRVIAVAYKDVPSSSAEYSVKDESDLTLIGFIAFLDPPKESAAQAVQVLSQFGVGVKVLTGDNDRVTKKICRDVGIASDEIILGSQIENMTDDQLDKSVEKTSVFAKLTPSQKERIIYSLKRNGHVVGFMGDGINDSPALKAADVGISVDNAVDVAKESADIILLEKSLLVLEEGVLEGRKVFGNIIKYIKMGASSNFGNVFSVLGASAFLPFLPMLPVQMLSQNLLYDISQTAIPFDNVDKEYLEKPRRWEIGDIARFMLYIGPVSSIFDYILFAVMWFVFKANSPAQAALFQTAWFVEGLVTQTLIVHIIRTRRIPFIQSRAATPLIFLTLVIIAAGMLIPFSFLGQQIGLQPLPSTYFILLAVIIAGYVMTTQAVKNWYIQRFGFN